MSEHARRVGVILAGLIVLVIVAGQAPAPAAVQESGAQPARASAEAPTQNQTQPTTRPQTVRELLQGLEHYLPRRKWRVELHEFSADHLRAPLKVTEADEMTRNLLSASLAKAWGIEMEGGHDSTYGMVAVSLWRMKTKDAARMLAKLLDQAAARGAEKNRNPATTELTPLGKKKTEPFKGAVALTRDYLSVRKKNGREQPMHIATVLRGRVVLQMIDVNECVKDQSIHEWMRALIRRVSR